MRRARTLRGDERGAALTEFGLLIIPLSVLMLGLLDLGYMMYTRSVLQGAVNDIVRQASLEDPQFEGEGTLEENIDEAIKDRLMALAADAEFTIDKKNYSEFSQVDQPEKLITDVDGDGAYDTGDCFQDLNANGVYNLATSRVGIGGADDVAVYDVHIVMPRKFPLATLAGLSPDYDINVKTAVRNQPYANQAEPPVVC